MATKQQLAQYCAEHFPSQIFHGVSIMHAVIASFAALAAGFGIGWYVKARGWFGVKVDATNVVTKVETDAKAIGGGVV